MKGNAREKWMENSKRDEEQHPWASYVFRCGKHYEEKAASGAIGKKYPTREADTEPVSSSAKPKIVCGFGDTAGRSN